MLKPLKGCRIVAIASFDSFIKAAQILLAECEEEGAVTELFVAEVVGRTVSRDQLQRAGVRQKLRRAELSEILSSSSFLEADAAILLCDGKRTKEIILQLQARGRWTSKRPALVAAYPGILYRLQVSGFMDRAPVDLLCLNSHDDLALYRRVCAGLAADGSNAAVTGLPLLWKLPRFSPNSGGDIVFFEQPSVPPHSLQREYVAHELCKLARRCPHREVKLKPRTRTREATFHRTLFHLEDLIGELKDKPPNLTITHEPVAKVFENCALALTFSSTAALESAACGIPTRIMTDLGVNETIGNNFFSESGMFTTFEQISGEEKPSALVDDWIEKVARPCGGRDIFIERLQRLLCTERTPREVALYFGSASWLNFSENRGGMKGAVSGRYPRTTWSNIQRFVRYLLRAFCRRFMPNP